MNYNYIHHISRYAPIGYAIVRTTGTVEPRSWHNHAPQLRHPMNGSKSRTRPAPIYAPRGGHRYKPRPEPRRHHLTHAADTGHTSPQRRHQHKAPCIVPLPGAAAATYNTPQTKATLPCINAIQSRVALFFLSWQNLEAGPNGIRALRHQSASEQVGSMSAPDLCPQLTATETQSPPRFSLWGRSFLAFPHVASYPDAQVRLRTLRQNY